MPKGIKGFQKGHKIRLNKKHSEETKIKIGLANSVILKGRKLSDETKQKISEGHKGLNTWMNGKKLTEKTRKKMSLTQKQRWQNMNEIQREKHSKSISLAHKGKSKPNQSGEKSHFWKGGITPINTLIRTSFTYKIWRNEVFRRDNYTCIFGGEEHGNKLNADHIKPFAYFPDLRFSLDNGRTLCVDCHRKTDTYAGRVFNYTKP